MTGHVARELPQELSEDAKRGMREKAARQLPEHDAFSEMSDEWLANEIRMLMRNDLWHEAFCNAGRDRIMRLSMEVARLKALINTPHTHEFIEAVRLEMPHQRERWSAEHDAGKTPAEWFWLVGYLAGKALHALVSGNIEKAKHHVVTTASALGNWFLAITGESTAMRPGIDPTKTLGASHD